MSKAPQTQTASMAPALLLHGWLDNCESFSHLIPLLNHSHSFCAVDMAGHGESDHRASAQGYPLTDYVCDLAELARLESEEPVDLIGHSLGGVVCLMYAAAFPERVRRLVLIDSLGPLTSPEDQFADNLRKGIAKRLGGSGQSRGYDFLDQAAQARVHGFSPIPLDAARTLVRRNLEQGSDGRLYWRTDPALRHPSFYRLSEAQALACISAVRVPVLLVTAEKGLVSPRQGVDARLAALTQAVSESESAFMEHLSVPGGHHCHMEESVGTIAQAIRNFLTSEH